MCRHNLQFHIKEFLGSGCIFLKSLGNYLLESALKEHYGREKKSTETEIPCATSVQSSSPSLLL